MSQTTELFDNLDVPVPDEFYFNDADSHQREYYIKSAIAEVDNLINKCQLSGNSSLLDVGCGQGRLATGLIAKQQKLQKYVGIDVNWSAWVWCLQNITRKHPFYTFEYSNVYNERYNPQSLRVIDDKFHFLFKDGEFDIIYAFSVFTHMEVNDVKAYLGEFARMLKPDGRGFFTAFLEDNVPDCVINPSDYLTDRYTWSGALHCVRYNTDYFVSLMKQNGLKLDSLVSHREHDGDITGDTEVYFSHG